MVVQVVFGKDISILEYLVTSSFKLISSKWLSYAWQRFSEKCWDKVRYMRSPCNDIFIQLYTGTLCVLCMEEDFQDFEKYICIYTEYFATSSH